MWCDWYANVRGKEEDNGTSETLLLRGNKTDSLDSDGTCGIVSSL